MQLERVTCEVCNTMRVNGQLELDGPFFCYWCNRIKVIAVRSMVQRSGWAVEPTDQQLDQITTQYASWFEYVRQYCENRREQTFRLLDQG